MIRLSCREAAPKVTVRHPPNKCLHEKGFDMEIRELKISEIQPAAYNPRKDLQAGREGMPQMQLPVFPAGVTEINSRIAVEAKDGQVCYVYGHLPVFQHEETDVRSFRMFTSQMIVTGSVKPKEIVETFGVPMVTVKRYMKV